MAQRPVSGGAYTGPRSEPGGQNTPRAGRFSGAIGIYNPQQALMAQHVDQGLIFDDSGSGTVTVGSTAALAYSTHVLADSPLAYWRGGVTPPPTIDAPLSDNSGHGYNLRLWHSGAGGSDVYPKDAPSLVAGDSGGVAMDFIPDSNFWMDQPDVPAVFKLGALSVELWCKPRSLLNTTWHDLFYKGDYYGLLISYSAPNYILSGWVMGVGSVQRFATSGPIAVDTLYHVVFTYDGSEIRLYVNGSLVDSEVIGSSLTGDSNLAIAQNAATLHAFDGIIDEVAVYNYAISSTRVQERYGIGTGAATTSEGLAYPDSRTCLVTASGSGSESYSTSIIYTDSASGSVIASGSGSESYSSPFFYVDSASGSGIASGTRSEQFAHSDSLPVTGVNYNATIDVDNPVSHWKLGEASQATDRKGAQTLLAVGGSIAVAPGLVANNGSDAASYFDGSVAFEVAPATNIGVPYSTATWTMEAWVDQKVVPDIPRHGLYRIFNQGVEGLNSSGHWTVLLGSQEKNALPGNPGIRSPGSGPHHLAHSFDNGLWILYFDGVEVSRSTGITPPAATVNNAPAIGGRQGVAGSRFIGIIDEAAWYNTALSPDRILEHYRVGLNPTIGSNGIGTEASVYTDSRTCTVGVTGTDVEAFSGSDSMAGTFTASGSGSESYSVAITYNDISTGTVTASGSGVEASSYTDSLAGTSVAVGTSNDSQSYLDTALGSLSVTGTSVDSQFYADTALGSLNTTGTSTDSQSYSDSASGSLSATGVSSDSSLHSLSATGTVAVNGTGIDSKVCDDILEGSALASGTGVESYTKLIDYVDANLGQINGDGDGVDAYLYTTTAQGSLVIDGDGIDSQLYTDEQLGSLVIDGDGVDSQLHTGAELGSLIISGDGVDAYLHTATAQGSLVISGTGSESHSQSYTDAKSGALVVNGTSSESHSYTSTALGSLFIDGTGSETYQEPSGEVNYSDVGSGNVISTGTGIDSVSYSYTAIGGIQATGAFTETIAFTNTASGTVTFSGDGADAYAYLDAAIGHLQLTGVGQGSESQTQPVPFSTITVLNRFMVEVRNTTSIRATVTSSSLPIVQVQVLDHVSVDVVKQDAMKVMVSNR